MPIIDVRGLRKVHGGRPVVDGVDLSVEEGEIVGVLGPNGAGKTTTVECIAGLRRPDDGTISVAGMDPRSAGTAFREAGTPRPTAADPALLRAVQEALSNAARHSGACRVAVSLDYLEDEVLLDVHDDGAGFHPGDVRRPSATGGHGLPSMAERLRLAGGTLAVESGPGAGCVVSAAVPG